MCVASASVAVLSEESGVVVCVTISVSANWSWAIMLQRMDHRCVLMTATHALSLLEDCVTSASARTPRDIHIRRLFDTL